MKNLVEAYRQRLFQKIWHSMIFLKEDLRLAQAYFEGAVKICQEIVNKVVHEVGITFNLGPVSRVMKGHVPDWYGNTEEEVDSQWWKDYFTKVIAATPLWGPKSVPLQELLKEIRTSSSHIPALVGIRTEVPLFMKEEMSPPTILWSSRSQSPNSWSPSSWTTSSPCSSHQGSTLNGSGLSTISPT